MKELRNYKDYRREFIGISDKAQLTAVFGSGERVKLNFGEDGSYHAYIVDCYAKFPGYYECVAYGRKSLEIFDDFGQSAHLYGDEIKIFQAGAFGCIIQLLNFGGDQ